MKRRAISKPGDAIVLEAVSLNTPQPDPTPASGDIWLMVINDMKARREFGIAKYGTPLQVANGRDPLIDAYQEALDMAVYLRQAIELQSQARIEAEKSRSE